MIRVETGSRLHFGLFNPACVPGVRRFGGVGLMIEEPSLRLTVSPATAWTAVGPLADRALAFAQRFASTLPSQVPRVFRLNVEQAPPEHAGFGTGTQLGLAVARACQHAAGLPPLDPAALGRMVGRGLRSGLGAHGFVHGGFLVDGGKSGDDGLAPLLVRTAFPPEWRLVIALADGAAGLHDAAEVEAFDRLLRNDRQTTLPDALCRLALLGMLPALAEKDIDAFGEALYEFNARVGEAFAGLQGGTYGSPRVAGLVEFVRRQGVKGAGQSSWGPAVFAVVADEERAIALVREIRDRYCREKGRVFVTRGRNRGAILAPRPSETEPDGL
jgi:beta-ribofuranosylaminobenzene 5'-phosphate synthase